MTQSSPPPACVPGRYAPPPHEGLEVLHLDASLIVLNKPSGLLSVPGRGESLRDSLATRVQQEFPEALIVHRLDMETSGVIVMARSKAAHRALSMAFERRETKKRYLSRVAGRLTASSGCVDLPLLSDWPNRPRQKVDPAHGKPSLTRYLLLDYDAASDVSRVALEPVTGRSHQLRIHMLALGHPILGDALYAPAQIRDAAPRLMLHAEHLAFPHPDHGDVVGFTCKAGF